MVSAWFILLTTATHSYNVAALEIGDCGYSIGIFPMAMQQQVEQRAGVIKSDFIRGKLVSNYHTNQKL
jgi:hypothetical protein